jgi:hypothetical protein
MQGRLDARHHDFSWLVKCGEPPPPGWHDALHQGVHACMLTDNQE